MTLLWNITLFLVGCSLYVAGAIWLVHRNKEKAKQAHLIEPMDENVQDLRVQTIESTLRSVEGVRRNRAANSDREGRRLTAVRETRVSDNVLQRDNELQHETASAAARRARINNLV
jgi:hypothetical protein